jgi:hypothetical protein
MNKNLKQTQGDAAFKILSEFYPHITRIIFNRRVDLLKGVAALVSSRQIAFFFEKEFIGGFLSPTDKMSFALQKLFIKERVIKFFFSLY